MTERAGETPLEPASRESDDDSRGEAYRAAVWRKLYSEKALDVATLEPFPLYEMLDRAADEFPGNACASIEDTVLSYAEVRDLSLRAAAGLARLGIGRGDRVGYCMPNSPAYTVFSFALWRLGAAMVGLNPLYAPDKLTAQARDARVKAVLVSDDPAVSAPTAALAAMPERPTMIVCAAQDHRLTAAGPAPDLAGGRTIGCAELLDCDDRIEPARLDLENTVAALQYTGGTTGEPKAAMLTHANLSVNVQQMHAWYSQLERGKEVLLAVAPFTHVSGVGPIQNFTVFMAGEIAMMKRFVAERALELIQTRRISVLLAPPTMFVGLMSAAEEHPIDWSSVKLVQSGAGPLTDRVRTRFEALCGVPVQNLYGMTETAPAAIYNLPLPAPAHPHPMAVGLPLPLTRVEIRAPDEPSRAVPVGETGEICIAGPQVMKGYWGKAAATGDAFVDGFFRSGDLGYMTPEGYFYVVDRLKDMIICSGYNVYPVQVENTISKHPAIREVAVIGVPDEYRGETVKMFAALKPGHDMTLESFREDMQGKLSPIEMPRYLEIMDELPKTPSAKISRLALREREATRSGHGE